MKRSAWIAGKPRPASKYIAGRMFRCHTRWVRKATGNADWPVLVAEVDQMVKIRKAYDDSTLSIEVFNFGYLKGAGVTGVKFIVEEHIMRSYCA